MKSYIVIWLVFIASLPLNAAQEKTVNKVGQIVSQSTLHKEPKHKSMAVSQLNENDTVNILQRHRAWYRISTLNKLNGWIKMLDVRFNGVLKRDGELGVKSVFDSVVNRQSTPTASTGIRGFDEEDLRNAIADMAQLKILATYITSTNTAKQFAKEGKLKTNPIVNSTENKE